MNTEKLETLKQIHIAIEALDKARGDKTLSPEQRADLESASVKLWNLEQAIIRKTGDELISVLKSDSDALNELARQIRESALSLREIAGAVENAAKFVKMLVNILVAAGAIGLI
jgi:hypothetical protein